MKLLLDTHIAIWWFIDDKRRLSGASRDAITGAEEVFVSVASAWEITIKHSLGKLDAPANFGAAVTASGCTLLTITLDHIAALGALPFEHRDPFDRMLIAQAKVEGLVMVTQDQRIKEYNVPILH